MLGPFIHFCAQGTVSYWEEQTIKVTSQNSDMREETVLLLDTFRKRIAKCNVSNDGILNIQSW